MCEVTVGSSTSKFTSKTISQARRKWLRLSKELYVVISHESLMDSKLFRSSTFARKAGT